MSGAKQVFALVDKDGNYIDTLNPLATTGGGGGGGGIVTQGAGSGSPTSPWTTRLSNGTAFVDPLTDAQLRASPVPVSLASLPLPTDAATETALLNVDANLTDIQTQQTNGTQRTKVTDGTNDVAVGNAAPVGTEYGLFVRQVGSTALPTGAATAVNQTTEIASLASIDSKLTSPLSVTGPLTDTQLRATAVPVSGPLTDTQLRATAVTVTGPLTDTQLRASAVAISATALPLPTGAATAANQTNGSQLAQISNGTNSAGVLNTTPAGTEYGLLVRTLGSTSAAITSIPYSGLTAAAVPVQAAYVGGTDSNGLLRGIAANADRRARVSVVRVMGFMVNIPLGGGCGAARCTSMVGQV